MGMFVILYVNAILLIALSVSTLQNGLLTCETETILFSVVIRSLEIIFSSKYNYATVIFSCCA